VSRIDVAVMGTVARVVVVGSDAEELAGAACVDLCRLAAAWSRFDATSDIGRINAHAGTAVPVGADTLTLVELSLRGYTVTGGAFDPTVLGDLVRAGYDRSFEMITEASARAARSDLACGALGIEVERAASTVRVPSGVGFDGGGIGKGLAADIVGARLAGAGAAGASINIGGDARVWGSAPEDAAAWTFDVEPPNGGGPLASIALRDGAIASSSTSKRAWGDDAQRAHHLIDPRRGRPVANDIASVSIVAARGWQAEVLTKAVFVAGVDEGFAIVDELGAAALVSLYDGTIVRSARWAAYERRRKSRPALQPELA
jgi:thiamine biosynthesis lipoprotein